MRFEELNWMDVEKYLEKDDRLILIIGATEQHGYLSLETDNLIAQNLSEAGAKASGVLLAPPMKFGASHYFLAYPGTISLRVETLLAVVEDMIRSAYYQGFRRFMVMNGHGGNLAIRAKLAELNVELKDMQSRFYSWWMTEVVADIGKKYDLIPGHANWEEAFPFTKVVPLPEGGKPFVRQVSSNNAEKVREILGDGSYGDKYEVSDEIMQEVFDGCLAEILDLLKFE